MDGLEATARIRAAEAGTNRHTPIIVLTAHAMKGDRERCLYAGADSYVSKPLQASELFRVVAKVLAADGKSEATATATIPAEPIPGRKDAGGETFDEAEALVRVDGDQAGLRQAAESMLARSAKDWEGICSAIAGPDYRAVARLAHKLKGQVSIFSARAARAAGELEAAGREENPERVTRACTVLASEIESLAIALRAWLDRIAPGGATT
jgi:CheY-like chemotaxis protein